VAGHEAKDDEIAGEDEQPRPRFPARRLAATALKNSSGGALSNAMAAKATCNGQMRIA
jgi:hypothetical protein